MLRIFKKKKVIDDKQEEKSDLVLKSKRDLDLIKQNERAMQKGVTPTLQNKKAQEYAPQISEALKISNPFKGE